MKLIFSLMLTALVFVGCTDKHHQTTKSVKAKTWDAKSYYSKAVNNQNNCLTNNKNYTKTNRAMRSIASTGACEGYSSIIYGGQTYNTGTVQVSNSTSDIKIDLTSNVANGWYIKATHIYVGTGPIPTNSQGVPAPGQFPFQESFVSLQSGLTYNFSLNDLAIGCGSKVNIAIHTEMVKTNSLGEIVQTETGWAYGPYTFSSNRWGWYFDYTICCEDPGDTGCTLTIGYWKTHNAYAKLDNLKIPWPVSEDTLLCGKSWLKILQTKPAGGNAWLILAHQWIAAKLNVANGASAPDIVQTAMAQGGQILSSNCAGIPTNLRQLSLEYSLVLDNYNNGLIGPGHCE